MRPDPDEAAVAPVGVARAAETPEVDPPAAAAAATEAAAGAPASEPAVAIAAAIASGALDATSAASRLIAETVAAQRPTSVEPAAWEAVQREVAAILAGDPSLEDLLAPL